MAILTFKIYILAVFFFVVVVLRKQGTNQNIFAVNNINMPQTLLTEFNPKYSFTLIKWERSVERGGHRIFLSVYTLLIDRPWFRDQCLVLQSLQYLYQNQDHSISHPTEKSSKRFSSLQNEKRGKERRGQERRKCVY